LPRLRLVKFSYQEKFLTETLLQESFSQYEQERLYVNDRKMHRTQSFLEEITEIEDRLTNTITAP
jgi:hypothetical protein